MAQNITIQGASYPDVPSVTLPKTGGGTAWFTDVTPTTAVESDVASGKVFFKSDGSQATGTATSQGGSPYPWLGNGAEKVGTIINQTINLKNDTTYDSWAASTTATTIKSASESPDYTASLNIVDYDYCIVTLGFVQPVYLSGTPMKSTTYRVAQYHVQYYYGYPTSSNTSAVQSNTATQALSLSSSSNMFVQLYYNSSGVLTARSATQCGAIYMSSTPTYSGTSVTDGNLSFNYKIPAFYAKCDSSRFTTTRKTQVDSANTNYILTVDLYRVPHGNGVFSKWVTEMCNALNT